jgi:hypothetical protein
MIQTVYERLGHAEVVKVDINADSPQDVKNEFKTFAKTYFAQFRKTRFGMQRLVSYQEELEGYIVPCL